MGLIAGFYLEKPLFLPGEDWALESLRRFLQQPFRVMGDDVGFCEHLLLGSDPRRRSKPIFRPGSESGKLALQVKPGGDRFDHVPRGWGVV